MLQSNVSELETKERLLSIVKKEVKQLMEEAVTKKYIHEESSSVTQLCAAVEGCLSNGLKRRALGLFKTSSTTALLHKIAKSCDDADYISKRVQDIEATDTSKRSCSSSESFNRPPMLKKGSSTSMLSNFSSSCSHMFLASTKYLWIRLALFEKRLVKIIEYLVENASSYYDRDALVADADYGSILSSLLVGPCALDFTRSKTADHYWTDPHADELVQRHRISSGRRSSSTCSRAPILNFKRSLNTSAEDSNAGTFKTNATTSVAKDYVESLHQNCRATLLYGKNNVLVQPKDDGDLMPGYLSLHHNIQNLSIKWTPNQLMNSYDDDEKQTDNSHFWAYALNISVNDIVYVHCHQNHGEDSGGIIILVGQDGVQRPPLHLPEGGHMQQFLSCLETGLLPHGQLDPPLWSQRGIGKIFPWPKSVRRRILPSVMESTDETPIDYVFRIVSKSKHEEFVAMHSILDFVRSTPRRAQLSSCSTTGSSDCSSKSISIDQYTTDSTPIVKTIQNQTASIELVCSSMRRQIISRAFYGWLAYCRHLSTVRTHLSGLVNGRITPELKADEEGLTESKWEQMQHDGVIDNEMEVFRLVYFGGMAANIRKEVWPYLLGHYEFGSTTEERNLLNENCKRYYETTLSEWLAVEAIVEQREKEKTMQAMVKLSLDDNNTNEIKGLDDDVGDLENEVFDMSDASDPVDSEFEIERARTKNQNTHLLVKTLPRAMKTSTDSGHVDDVLMDDLVHEDNILKIETNTMSNEDILESKDSTSSSTSYVTFGNDANVRIQKSPSPALTEDQTKSPDYLSADDLNTQVDEEVFDVPEETAQMIRNQAAFVITTASVDFSSLDFLYDENENGNASALENIDGIENLQDPVQNILQEPKSTCASPASSNGGVYSSDLLETFGLNLHRIEKDVQRCDRNYWYFANENLYKLRNVITTYVWEHLDVGYMQGMCDLVAPLLVIFDDESLTYSCFCKLMERMIENFPNGGAMDMHFANMRSLIQILDSEMYDLMDSNGDYTHFYFCYRWFLLDFKRELVYEDVFTVWEVIWAAKHVASAQFVLFLALALLEAYRDIILSNSMDFTDVIKFFNEMAERHNVVSVLQLARSLVLQLQMIIENK